MIALFQWYRIAAAFLILLIHQQYWNVPPVAGRINCLAVPMFSAISGYLFAGVLAGEYKVSELLLKKGRRILLPYVLWACIYWIANNVVLDGIVKHEAISFPGVRDWLLGGTACHLWFLPSLFIVFVVFVVLGAVAKRIKIAGWIIAAVVITLAALTQFIVDDTSATIPGYVKIYFGRLLFYFGIGLILAHLSFKPVIGYVTVGVLTVCGCMNVVTNIVSGMFWNPFMLVIGLIVLAKTIPIKTIPNLVKNIAAASMGIYLIHVLFTSAANYIFARSGYVSLPPFWGFVVSVFLFVMSYFAVRLLPKRLF